MLLADSGAALAEVRAAMEAALERGPGLGVLPAGPPDWRAAVHRALCPERSTPPGLVVPTSGSTGQPRAAVLSADAVRYSAQATVARLGGPGGWVLALPLTHVAGLMVLARAVVAGAEVVRLDLSLRQAVAALPPGRRYLAVVPTQLRRLLATEPDALGACDAVLVGGAPLDATLREQATLAGVHVVESYGMTETCGGFVHDGLPLPGVEVTLDEVGGVAVSGPVLADAYRESRGDRPIEAPLATADVGRWVDGRLQVLGRRDEVVMSGGVSVALPAVDALLAQHPAVGDAVAVGVPDPEWGSTVVGLVVARGGVRCDPDDVRRYVAERAEAAYVPRQVLVVDDLRRPAPGKVNRADLARRLEEGAWPR